MLSASIFHNLASGKKQYTVYNAKEYLAHGNTIAFSTRSCLADKLGQLADSFKCFWICVFTLRTVQTWQLLLSFFPEYPILSSFSNCAYSTKIIIIIGLKKKTLALYRCHGYLQPTSRLSILVFLSPVNKATSLILNCLFRSVIRCHVCFVLLLLFFFSPGHFLLRKSNKTTRGKWYGWREDKPWCLASQTLILNRCFIFLVKVPGKGFPSWDLTE